MELPEELINASKNLPQNASVRWNAMREKNYQFIYDRNSICSLLEKNNFLNSNTALTVYVKDGIISRIKRGQYKFTEKPIFIDKINSTLKHISTYCKEHKDTAKPEKEIKLFTDEELIAELKNRHYKVYKRQISYEEV